jgi:hypothetical protein
MRERVRPWALLGFAATERSIFGRAAASCPSSDSAMAWWDRNQKSSP